MHKRVYACLMKALKAGWARHAELVAKYGSEAALAIAQSDGTFASKERPRSMFSVTTDPAIAAMFGRTIYKAIVSEKDLIKQPLGTSGESEYFMRAIGTGFERLCQ